MSKLQEYIKITHDGSSCIMEPHTALDFLKEINLYEDPDEYSKETVMLTQQQFDDMPEFAGF